MWGWGAIAALATALEWRALRPGTKHATLSSTVQRLTRRHPLMAVVAWGAFSAWLAHHLWYDLENLQ